MLYLFKVDWLVEFYRDERGREPVADFLNSLAVETRARATKLIDLLARYGVLLKEPYTRHVRGKIRELRIRERAGKIRVLYFAFTGRRFILLHGFIKKTEKTPSGEIEIAEKRMNDFIKRYGGEQ